jgi:hypothetical protein
VFVVRVPETFKMFGRMFLHVCLLDLLGSWLAGRAEMVGLGRLHSHIRKNRHVEKPGWTRTVGLFSFTPYSPLH